VGTLGPGKKKGKGTFLATLGVSPGKKKGDAHFRNQKVSKKEDWIRRRKFEVELGVE